MSVRSGLLVLLAERPMYGYELKQEFERRTGATWPLNIGQVYQTLGRLERDGLVEEVDRRDDGSVVYDVTPAGRQESERWWATPVERQAPARDELAIKLALAVTLAGVDVVSVVQHQRAESMRSLAEYTRLKARRTGSGAPEDLAWELVLESLVFAAEAEVRWLDHVEQTVLAARAARGGDRDGGGGSATLPVRRPVTRGRR